MKKTLRRILSGVVTIAMVASVSCLPAFAAVALDPVWHIGEDGSLLSHKEFDEDNVVYESYNYYLDDNITLEKTLIVKDNVNASIDLNGNTLMGAGNGSVIKVDGASLTIDDSSEDQTGTITGGTGNAEDNEFGGGVYVSGGAKVTLEAGTISGNTAKNGGGVYVGNGTFTMNGGVIENNTGRNGGGGVYLNVPRGESKMIMKDGTISNNTGAFGGGIGGQAQGTDNGYQIPDYAVIDITGGTISDNHGTIGGGVYLGGGGSASVSIVDADISNNDATNGGGIYVSDATVSIKDNTITGNTATVSGGGVQLQNVNAQITNSTISGNTANAGGGMYLSNATVSVENSTISNNTANAGGGMCVLGSKAVNSNVTIDSTTKISDNKSVSSGGGIYVGGISTDTYDRKGSALSTVLNVYGQITGNTAGLQGGGILAYNGAKVNVQQGALVQQNTAEHSGADIAAWSNGVIYRYNTPSGEMDGHEISGWYRDNYGARWEDGNYSAYEGKGYWGGLYIAAFEHEWGETGYVWSDDLSTCTALRVCGTSVDDDHTETETATVTSEITVQPTTTSTGLRVYIAVFENSEFGTVTMEEVIPMLPIIPDEPDTTEIEDEAVEIDDEEVPLAGMVTVKELLGYLYEREGYTLPAAPEDSTDLYDYTPAIEWAIENGIVDEGVDPNMVAILNVDGDVDPDELVVVCYAEGILTRYAAFKGSELVYEIEGKEDDDVVDEIETVLKDFLTQLNG